MDPAAMSSEGDEEWVLCHDDDGFIYKILKRQPLFDISTAVQPPVIDAKAEERRRKQRIKKALLKVKNRYQKEIDQWELLSNNLRSMQDRANQHQNVCQTASLESPSTAVKEGSQSASGSGSGSESRSLIDKLLHQAEAQEAIIHDVSQLCDMAESMCNTQQELLVQSYMDLPVWSSPSELIASLCDEPFWSNST